jgi:hypothetical protein
MTLSIFLNYRRDDTAGHAGRLYDALSVRFGVENVFMDVDAIEPGIDFTEIVAAKVADCDVLLAIIGRNWLLASDKQGRRRLEQTNDFVRLELQAALERENTRVIPVLVQDAVMPSTEDLPEELARLAFHNAVQLRDTSWAGDVKRLVGALERLTTKPFATVIRPVTPRFVLRSIGSFASGSDFVLSDGTIRAGRAGGEEIQIEQVEVSRHHAAFRVEGERLVVEDAGSGNGTFVNGTRIHEPTELHVGDIVALGTEAVQLEVELPAERSSYGDLRH